MSNTISVLTQSRLKRLLHYNPETGIFTRIIKPRHIGDIAGFDGGNGYIFIWVGNKKYLAHRLAWLYMEGYFPEEGIDVDHKDRDKSNNKWANLRMATRSCNNMNKSLQSNNTSGIKGVSIDSGKWKASITLNKKRHYLGCFKEKHEAAMARYAAEKKYNFNNCCLDSSAHTYLKNEGLI
jgi:hypothetical protein